MRNNIPIDLSGLLAVVKPLAVRAGKAIMKIYETEFEVELKGDKSPVTLADTAANEIIVLFLRENFPAYAILAEESKDNLGRLANDFCFIVDPLDGTKEFIKRNGQFTVNIALAYKHKSVLGVVYAPVAEHLYYACEGGGAFFEDLKSGEKRQIHVSDRLDGITVVGSRSHSSPEEAELFEKYKDNIGYMISVGSSLKGCLVAAGEADVYYRFGPTSEWDTAAMQCIVEEAGGIFRQTDGTPMRYNREDIINRIGFYAVNRVENIWI
jgi:3'(2'), 5'-bisphosphate nucleotidase